MSCGAKSLALWTLVVLALLAGCSEKENPAESGDYGDLSGTIHFVGEWPETGDVQVSVWASWPPAGPPAAATDPFTPGQTSATYRIEGLAKATYVAVTVGWRDPAHAAGGKVLGVYWEEADSLGVDPSGVLTVQPTPIQIAEGSLVWTDVDLKADLGIVP